MLCRDDLPNARAEETLSQVSFSAVTAPKDEIFVTKSGPLVFQQYFDTILPGVETFRTAAAKKSETAAP
jgi:hypothetical protein